MIWIPCILAIILAGSAIEVLGSDIERLPVSRYITTRCLYRSHGVVLPVGSVASFGDVHIPGAVLQLPPF